MSTLAKVLFPEPQGNRACFESHILQELDRCYVLFLSGKCRLNIFQREELAFASSTSESPLGPITA